jgi:hypothetical protein
VGHPKKYSKRKRGLSRTPALLFTHSLALAGRVGREMLDEYVGVVLKDVMDGKGKRFEINVRPVLATELEVISESLEVHSDLVLFININIKNVSRHRNGKIETYNRERLDRPLALDERDPPHARRSRWSSLGRTTLTAATGEYNEESERAVSQHHHSRRLSATVSSLIVFGGKGKAA